MFYSAHNDAESRHFILSNTSVILSFILIRHDNFTLQYRSLPLYLQAQLTMSQSVYFPPQWVNDKLSHAFSEDLLKLSDEDRTTIFDSRKMTLGPDGFKALLQDVSNNYKARMAAAEKASSSDLNDELPPEIRAPFLASLKQLYLEDWEALGFVRVSDNV